ncbi:hypothetical protein D9756_005785 [Leucocoprinus leucothites]|uniref:NADP-dependent oxidoreductase domain-containing protein n=1 Tax=Leucocoprinus leucothites TaxID=201217 RepID=A0A8H5FYZ4_9AGAR|nr:hypothetical protein D9756_005785 [Leucoagaricus leucothites]
MLYNTIFTATLLAVAMAQGPRTCYQGAAGSARPASDCISFIDTFCNDASMGQTPVSIGDSTGRCFNLPGGDRCDFIALNTYMDGVSPNNANFSWDTDDQPLSLDEVQARVEGSLQRLGFMPDLFLIHNPFIAAPGELKRMWEILEGLKDEGKLKSIGVSNFRPQDLEAVLDGAKHKPVANQLEFHPYVLAHLEPVLELQKKHGIITQSYGTLTPLLRHPTGGPLKPILADIAARLSKETGKPIDEATVLLLWARAKGVVVVSTSGNLQRLQWLGEVAKSPLLLTEADVEMITNTGKTIHFRNYSEHMEKEFPLPNLPSQ